jgi:hypothetical protein
MRSSKSQSNSARADVSQNNVQPQHQQSTFHCPATFCRTAGENSAQENSTLLFFSGLSTEQFTHFGSRAAAAALAAALEQSSVDV